MFLRLDPWAVEYNTAYHAETIEEAPSAAIDVRVEHARWEAITPGLQDPPYDDVIFLDGTRRIEARVLLEDEGRQQAFGALGSYGVGAVHCCARQTRRAEILPGPEWLLIERVCALSAGKRLKDFDAKAQFQRQLGALHYRVSATGERDPDAVVRHLQALMREAEGRLASRLVDHFPQALILCDGPRPYLGGEPAVVGYVKTIHQPRVGEKELELVRNLAEGERSPLYLVKSDTPERQFFEWFFRLRDPSPWLYSLAAIVRLQAYAGPNPEARLAEVQRLADWLCGVLPKFASRQHQDPRAPQQLLPVRGLEQELSRRMGHPAIVRQRITQYLSQQGVLS